MPIREEQKTNKQHAVPQNIMDVEFKIIGDLTMRQFLYLLVFGGLAYGSFAFVPSIFKWPFVLLFAFMGFGLAFVPLEERSLDKWIVNFFRSIYSPTQRIWRKSISIPTAFDYQNIAFVKQELITLAPTSSRRKLEEYLEVQSVSEKIDVLDIPEKEYINKVRMAFAVLPQPEEAPMPVVVSPVTIASLSEKKEVPKPQPQIPLQPSVSEQKVPVQKPVVIAPVPKPELKVSVTQKPIQMQPQAPVIKKAASRIPKKPISDFLLSPMTPDRHTGRRFTNLAPGHGHLVLPIRGERVLRTSEEMEIEEGIQEKTEQLQQLMTRIKSEHTKLAAAPKPASVSKEVVPQNVRTEATEIRKVEGVPSPIKASNFQHVGLEQQPLTSMPNVISGVLQDKNGNLLDGVVLVVKNNRGEPVRALKTNVLGQFIITTPLPNGKYTLSIDETKKTQLGFDIISVDLMGGVVPPLEITGH